MGSDDRAPESEVANTIARVMMQMSAATDPIFEAGAALRRRLVDDGWSEVAAERIAQEVVMAFIRKVFGS